MAVLVDATMLVALYQDDALNVALLTELEGMLSGKFSSGSRLRIRAHVCTGNPFVG